MHEVLCGLDNRTPLVPSLLNPEEIVTVSKFLEEKRSRDLNGDPSFVKLFKENESFDIEKVLKPPREHIDAIRQKVENDAFERAKSSILKEEE